MTLIVDPGHIHHAKGINFAGKEHLRRSLSLTGDFPNHTYGWNDYPVYRSCVALVSWQLLASNRFNLQNAIIVTIGNE